MDARSTVDWPRVLCEVTTVWYAYIQLCNPMRDVNRFLDDTLGSRMMYIPRTPSRFDVMDTGGLTARLSGRASPL